MTDFGAVLRNRTARVFLAATRWKIKGQPPGPEQTCIFVGAPHTSSYDTILMLATAWRCNLRVKFLIKQEFTSGKLGPLLIKVGAIPVDRENPGPLVDQLTVAAASDQGFQLVLTPEGTRKRVKYWKSGFYRFATMADIPMALVAPDKPTKTVTFGPIFKVTDDVVADMDKIRDFFATQHGVIPENRSVPRLQAEDDADSLATLRDPQPQST
jgi:1-acyl-sn-glycerol-3-phosphate acyltransferase